MAQEPETTGERLVDTLDNLRKQLNILVDRLERSGVQRTNGLRQTMGRDCEYYRKSVDLLLRKDYVDLRNLVKNCHELFEEAEGYKPNG